MLFYRTFRRFYRNSNFNIPINKLRINTCRSSGPGGQSVNKSETKVQIRFNIDDADWIDDDLKEKFKIVNKITQKGEFIVECDDFSNQNDNKKACLEKVKDAIDRAKKYEPAEDLTFLERIQKEKSPDEILRYKLQRRENRMKKKKIGHKTLDDF